MGLGLALGLVAAGCAPGAGLPEAPGRFASTPAPDASFEPVPTLTVPPAVTSAPVVDATLAPLEPSPAPTERFVVSRREIAVARDERPLRTVIFHPTIGRIGDEWVVPPGTFPLILFSHGLRGSPEIYEPSLRTIASAGFVVAAPEYPNTSADAAGYNPVDLVNQPADASAVITAVLGLNTTEGDALAGHLDPARVAAMGHSAGGYTTLGLLAAVRDVRIRAAIVIAGASLGGSYAAPALPVLFVHGSADEVVPYAHGRAAYDQVPWPKAFLTVVAGGHADYLYRRSPASSAVTATVLDFLRASLYGDVEALARMPGEAAVENVTTFESTLGEGER
jgi:predicted dienelactone hydrolase